MASDAHLACTAKLRAEARERAGQASYPAFGVEAQLEAGALEALGEVHLRRLQPRAAAPARGDCHQHRGHAAGGAPRCGCHQVDAPGRCAAAKAFLETGTCCGIPNARFYSSMCYIWAGPLKSCWPAIITM